MPEVTKQYYNPLGVVIGALRSTAFSTKMGVDGIGTATVPTNVIYKTFLTEGLASFDYDLKIDKMGLTNLNDIGMNDTREFVENYSSRPKINWSGPWQHKVMALALACAFQNVTEGALTPFSKTFIFPTTPINFAGGSGYVANVGAKFVNMGGAGYGTRIRSAIVDSITIDIVCNAEGYAQVVKTTINWIGLEPQRNLNFATQYQTITFAAEDKSFLAGRKVVCNISNVTQQDGFTTPFKTFSVTINTNSTVIGTTTAGYADSYLISPTMSMSCAIPYTLEMSQYFSNIILGNLFTVEMTFGTPTTDGGLSIICPGKIKNDLPVGAESDHLTIPIEMDCVKSGATEPKIIMTDTIDWVF